MRILPNPAKEAINRRKHGLDFSGVGEVLTNGSTVDYPDDRPLGYEHEGRVRLLGLLGARVVVLVFEPVELPDGTLGVRPISLYKADAKERRVYARKRRW
jgi:uncharacterized DUF497 family protein